MELKECPFCGGKAILVPLSNSSGYIACIGKCDMKTGTYWDEPMKEPKENRTKWHDLATAAWNRRANNG